MYTLIFTLASPSMRLDVKRRIMSELLVVFTFDIDSGIFVRCKSK